MIRERASVLRYTYIACIAYMFRKNPNVTGITSMKRLIQVRER